MIDPWPFVLVALAAWRTFHILAHDTILDRPREGLIQQLGDAGTGGKVEEFLICPFCLGAWTALAWVAAYWLTPHWTVVVALPFAVSAVVALVQIVADALVD